MDPHFAVKKLKSLCFMPKNTPLNFRQVLRENFINPFLPNRVDCRRMQTSGIACDLFTPEICAKNRMLLYVHGGSFVGGDCEVWHSFCASLSHEASTRLMLPEIRLAPEFPFPSALSNVQAVFSRMYEKIPNIYLAAEGSGASIALGFFSQLNKEQRAAIKGIILFSPWLDISPASAAFTINPRKNPDAVLSPDVLQTTAPLYTYAENFCNPLVSPAYMEPDDLRDFPPIFLQVGGNELLLPDVQRFAKKLCAANVQCTVDVWESQCHLFQFADDGDCAYFAVSRAGKYIKNIAQQFIDKEGE